jgi:putative methyltransferase (TIGR04325 family)
MTVVRDPQAGRPGMPIPGQRLLRSAVRRARALLRPPVEQYGWQGNFATWAEAKRQCSGYDSDVILERVKTALLKVKHGEAVYERDSVLFDKKQYSWPVLASLLWIASLHQNRLTVLDFGGSLGTTYFQNREFLRHLPALQWFVVEQPNFVAAGRTHFQDETLKFADSVSEVMGQVQAKVCLLSSVLHYLERPFALIDELTGAGIEFLLLDMVPFLYEGTDRITLQRVPPDIYPASYPAWFFNQNDFLSRITASYEMVADFEAYVGQVLNIEGRPAGGYRGMLLRRKG